LGVPTGLKKRPLRGVLNGPPATPKVASQVIFRKQLALRDNYRKPLFAAY
jgi:hypothetical protein